MQRGKTLVRCLLAGDPRCNTKCPHAKPHKVIEDTDGYRCTQWGYCEHISDKGVRCSRTAVTTKKRKHKAPVGAKKGG